MAENYFPDFLFVGLYIAEIIFFEFLFVGLYIAENYFRIKDYKF